MMTKQDAKIYLYILELSAAQRGPRLGSKTLRSLLLELIEPLVEIS